MFIVVMHDQSQSQWVSSQDLSDVYSNDCNAYSQAKFQPFKSSFVLNVHNFRILEALRYK